MSVPLPSRRSSATLSLALVLAACAAPKPAAPPPAPAPAPAPPPTAADLDWRDAPLTPGDWRYAQEATGDSVARFADGLFEARCVRARHMVQLTRAGPLVTSANPRLLITTSTSTLTLQAAPAPAGAVAELPATNAGLDQIAFSRGRFRVVVTGLATLLVPSWPEFARVVEDCRRPDGPL